MALNRGLSKNYLIMKYLNLLFFSFGFLFITSCENSYYAKIDHYYYYFDNPDPEWMLKVKPLLEVDSNYFFSTESVTGPYPYYETVSKATRVPVQKISAPHTTLRSLSPFDVSTDYPEGSRKMEITLHLKSDSILLSHILVYRLEKDNWRKIADTGDHIYNLNQKEEKQIVKEVSMHIIRAAFK